MLPFPDSSLAIRDAGPGVAVVMLGGRVDAASVRTQRSQLHGLFDKGVRHVAVDLEHVTFLDSAGMAMLVGVLKRAHATNGEVCIVQPADETVQRILRLTRLDLVFHMQNTLDAALRDLERSDPA
jgi:anti-sigma B factor antagonist